MTLIAIKTDETITIVLSKLSCTINKNAEGEAFFNFVASKGGLITNTANQILEITWGIIVKCGDTVLLSLEDDEIFMDEWLAHFLKCYGFDNIKWSGD